MPAAGKTNASRVQINDRIIVQVREGGRVDESSTKTGEGVQVARVIGKEAVQGGQTENGRVYSGRMRYLIHTTAGSFSAAPIQTMWLAPEDNAGVKRAHVEALAEDRERELAEHEERAAKLAAEDDAVEAIRQATETPVEVTTIGGDEPVQEAPVVARPAVGSPEMAQLVGRVLRTEPLTFQLPNVLTLHSQAGKVQDMDIETALAQPTTAQKHTGSTVVALIERVWDRIRADHPELPEVVVTTGSGEGVKWGHFRPESWKLAEQDGRLHEFFLSSEALAKGATQVLQTTIHEAAHTLSKARGIKDTSRQGRWHNAEFKKAAEELGLEHKAKAAHKSHGFSFVTLTEATKARYADVLAELERELKLTGLLPSWLGGSDEEDQGGEKITGKPKGEDEGKPKSGNLKATCLCEEPVIVRLSQKVMDLGVVRCDDCKALFMDRS